MTKSQIYYCNPFLTTDKLEFLQQNKCALHSFYGLFHFSNDIEVIIHKQREYPKSLIGRIIRNFSNTIKIISAYRTYDLIYLTNSRGIKLIALLRALKIFPKPICMLIHWGIIPHNSALKRFVSQLYISGFDYLFFFNKELCEESIKTGKVKNGRVVHWGADLDFFNTIDVVAPQPIPFLSTGVERRDFQTLLKAFEKVAAPLTLYATENHSNTFVDFLNKPLMSINLVKEKIDLTLVSVAAECIVIPLAPSAGNKICPLGLTSLVEAMALAKPVIITHNCYNGIDVEKIGCGIAVGYGDIEGWAKAIRFMTENKELAIQMGKKGKEYIDQQCNLNIFGQELSEIFKEISAKKCN